MVKNSYRAESVKEAWKKKTMNKNVMRNKIYDRIELRKEAGQDFEMESSGTEIMKYSGNSCSWNRLERKKLHKIEKYDW